jgi:hypothetical protein
MIMSADSMSGKILQQWNWGGWEGAREGERALKSSLLRSVAG